MGLSGTSTLFFTGPPRVFVVTSLNVTISIASSSSSIMTFLFFPRLHFLDRIRGSFIEIVKRWEGAIEVLIEVLHVPVKCAS